MFDRGSRSVAAPITVASPDVWALGDDITLGRSTLHTLPSLIRRHLRRPLATISIRIGTQTLVAERAAV